MGGAAAAIDLTALVGLHGAGLGVVPSAAMALEWRQCSTLVSRRGSSSARRQSQRRFALFVAFALAGLGINTAVTMAAAVGLLLPAVLAKILGIGTAFLFNVTANAFVVFVGRPSR